MADDELKTEQNKKECKGKVRLYYSMLTIVLILCIVYLSYSVFLNVSKSVNMPSKLLKMRALNKAAIAQNKKLKAEISDFESLKSLEAIARNNLKMAGEDEILVIVNKSESTNEKKTQAKKTD